MASKQAFKLVKHVNLIENENGAVLLNERTGSYWQTNGSGAVVLRSLLDGGSVDSAVSALAERYPDVPETQLRTDVEAVLTRLRDGKLVTS